MSFLSLGFGIAIGLFLVMLLLQDIGRRAGARRLRMDPDGARSGVGVVEGAVFGLVGLLIAFTFSGAAARLDARRQLVIDEANAIGTAYLRLDLLPTADQPAIREAFRRYVDSRLNVYRLLPDVEAAKQELKASAALQAEIWTKSVLACSGEQGATARMLLLPALNQMIDVTTTRTTVALSMHPPDVIFVMLWSLMLASALIAGYGMAGSRSRSWTHMVVFAAGLAVTAYVILDLEYPRTGLIRLDAVDRVLVEVRESMK